MQYNSWYLTEDYGVNEAIDTIPRSYVKVDVPTGSFRSLSSMGKSTECLRKGYGGIHFLHMRKAGGTTIEHALSGPSEASGSPLKVWHSEGWTFNISCFDSRSLVHVTSLRDPIERILGSYWSEGRHPAASDIRHTSTLSDFDDKSGGTGKQTGLKALVSKFRSDYLPSLSSPISFKDYVDAQWIKYLADPEEYR